MSHHRRKSAPRITPVAPDGTKLCKCGCGQPVGKGRRSWAGEECVEKWNIANNPQHVRNLLMARDRGVCRVCGRDVERAMERFAMTQEWHLCRRWNPINRRMAPMSQKPPWSERVAAWRKTWPSHLERAIAAGKKRRERMAAEGWPVHLTTSWWQADHIVAVAEGGGQPTTLDAYRTLCHRCHVEETKALRKRLKASKAS